MNINQLVSVIIPNYNHAKYLDERIQSILSQTYTDFEIIILDDCSTDESRQVIEKYRANSHVSRVVYNETNSGMVFSQWRKGIELAKGDLIWIAESDDSCHNSLLENLVKEFEDENVVLSFCKSLMISDKGALGIYPSQQFMNKTFRCDGRSFIKKYLVHKNIVVNASSAVFRKSAFYEIPTDYTEYKGVGDWLFWIYLAERGAVCYAPLPLNYFRKHDMNTTSRLDVSGNNPKETNRIFNYLINSGYLNGWNCYRVKITRISFYLNGIPFNSPSVKEEVLKTWNVSKLDFLVANVYWILQKVVVTFIHASRSAKQFFIR